MAAEATHVNCFRTMNNVSIAVGLFTFLVSLLTLLFKFEASLSVSPNFSFGLGTEVSRCTDILTELWFSWACVVLPSWFCFFKAKSNSWLNSLTVMLKSRCNVQKSISMNYGYLQQLNLIPLVMYQKHYFSGPQTAKHILFHLFGRLIAYDHARIGCHQVYSTPKDVWGSSRKEK